MFDTLAHYSTKDIKLSIGLHQIFQTQLNGQDKYSIQKLPLSDQAIYTNGQYNYSSKNFTFFLAANAPLIRRSWLANWPLGKVLQAIITSTKLFFLIEATGELFSSGFIDWTSLFTGTIKLRNQPNS